MLYEVITGWALVAILVGGAVGICGTAWAIANMENVDLKSATPPLSTATPAGSPAPTP